MSLELLFSLEKANINCKEAAVVCAIHTSFLKNGFKCIGRGEEFPVQDVQPSDLLPPGWSEDKDCYSLLYQQATVKFMLKLLNVDGQLFVHLLRDSDKAVVDLELDPNYFVSDDLSTYRSAYVHHEKLDSLIQTSLASRLSANPASPKASPRNAESEKSVPHSSNTPRPQPLGSSDPDGMDPFSIGRNDLDPLAAGSGSGMIFDPFYSHDPLRHHNPRIPGFPAGRGGYRIPPGSVPPGARFDPIGPSFDPRRTMDPDPDELLPPDYNNMFM